MKLSLIFTNLKKLSNIYEYDLYKFLEIVKNINLKKIKL